MSVLIYSFLAATTILLIFMIFLDGEADVEEKEGGDTCWNGEPGMRSSRERSLEGGEQNTVRQPEGENLPLLVKTFCNINVSIHRLIGLS